MDGPELPVSVVVVTWDGRGLLPGCLESLEAQSLPRDQFEILVADNGSRDGTLDWLRSRHPGVRALALGENLGFAAANNRAAAEARGAWLVLVNNDAMAEPLLLERLLARGKASTADAVAARILDWSGDSIEFGGGHVNLAGYGFARSSWHPGFVEAEDGAPLPFACGAAMAVRRDRFLALGGFDAEYFAYYEDVDLGYRLNLSGSRVVYAREAAVRHRRHATAARQSTHWRHLHWYRNTLLTLVKNAGADTFGPRLAAGLALLFARVSTLNGEAAAARARGEHNAAADLAEAAAGAAEGLAWVLARWETALAKRAAVQALRTVSDAELARRFGGFPAEFGPDVAAWPENALAARLFHSFEATASLLPEGLDAGSQQRFRDADLSALRADNERLGAVVRAMRGSWSWRWSAPARRLLDYLRRS